MKINYSNLLRLAIVIAAILAIAVTTVGVLATPVIMAIKFSWYWLLLYIGYLVVALYLVAYMDSKLGGTRR